MINLALRRSLFDARIDSLKLSRDSKLPAINLAFFSPICLIPKAYINLERKISFFLSMELTILLKDNSPQPSNLTIASFFALIFIISEKFSINLILYSKSICFSPIPSISNAVLDTKCFNLSDF